jgi:dihydrofolate reductase
MLFNLIVCCDNRYGIGRQNTIPWRFTKDIMNFKKITKDNITNDSNDLIENKRNIVIMGNNTYKSILDNYRPLKHRINIVISKSHPPTEKHNLENYNYIISNPIYFNNIQFLLIYINAISSFTNECFIIGGSQIYNMFLDLKLVNKIYLTKPIIIIQVNGVNDNSLYKNNGSMKLLANNLNIDLDMENGSNAKTVKYFKEN